MNRKRLPDDVVALLRRYDRRPDEFSADELRILASLRDVPLQREPFHGIACGGHGVIYEDAARLPKGAKRWRQSDDQDQRAD